VFWLERWVVLSLRLSCTSRSGAGLDPAGPCAPEPNDFSTLLFPATSSPKGEAAVAWEGVLKVLLPSVERATIGGEQMGQASEFPGGQYEVGIPFAKINVT